MRGKEGPSFLIPAYAILTVLNLLDRDQCSEKKDNFGNSSPLLAVVRWISIDFSVTFKKLLFSMDLFSMFGNFWGDLMHIMK